MNETYSAPLLHRWNRVFLLVVMLWLLSIVLGWFYPWRGELILNHFINPALLALSGIWLYARGSEMRWEQGLLAGLMAWYAVTRVINGPHYLDADYETVCQLAGIALVAFPLASLFEGERRERVFKLLAAMVVVLLGTLAWVSVAAVVLRQLLQAPGSDMIIGINEVHEIRLNFLNMNPNLPAAIFTFVMGLTLALYTSIKRWWCRIPVALMGLGLYAGVAITFSRTAMAVAPLELAGFAFLALRKGIRSRPGFPKGLVVLLASVAVLVASMLGLYGSVDLIEAAANRHQARQVQNLAQESGVAAQQPEVKEAQDLAQESDPAAWQAAEHTTLAARLRLIPESVTTFAGRLDKVYPAAIPAIKERPAILLIGARTDQVTAATSLLAGHYIAHWHNSFLQSLMAAGVPALLLTLAFSALLVRKSVRLARSSQTPLGAQALMVPLLGLLLHSMMEHFVFLDTAIPNVLFMIFAGFLFAHGAGERA